jgi:glycosyltransferase involved in cell wall biosynthesis
LSVYTALKARPDLNVGFLRHNRKAGGFYVVDWSQVEALRDFMSEDVAAAAPRPPAQQAESRLKARLLILAEAIPAEARLPLLRAAQGQVEVALNLSRSLRALLRLLTYRPPWTAATRSRKVSLDEVAQPGDVLCSFGSPWVRGYDQMVMRAKARGLRYALLVYDLIPILHPEFHGGRAARTFGEYMRTCAALADHLLTISEATALDVADWAQRERLPLLSAPMPIPIGTEMDHVPPGQLPGPLTANSYVLLVSTIEPRKNHLQAFRIWCKLLEALPRERVPNLVFAGSVGWMVEDLMQAMRATNYLDGKLVLVQEPDDSTLAALYANCRFTLFTSLYEGWGLPVSESLAFGKTGVIANRSSVPEAGGDFCLYIDPDNTTGAYEVVRKAIEDPAIVRRMEAEIAARYRPTSWSVTAASIAEALGAAPPPAIRAATPVVGAPASAFARH